MLVKCAVRVNQRYEEINQIQFLLLMDFFISCQLLSLFCAGRAGSSRSSSFVPSCSVALSVQPHVKKARSIAFLWRAASHGQQSERGLSNGVDLLVNFDAMRIRIPQNQIRPGASRP